MAVNSFPCILPEFSTHEPAYLLPSSKWKYTLITPIVLELAFVHSTYLG